MFDVFGLVVAEILVLGNVLVSVMVRVVLQDSFYHSSFLLQFEIHIFSIASFFLAFCSCLE
jgi:hypothetical protein